MSDFDEEAERERLREQFEKDRKKREATEQMSELLLQGATMTDTHCETCGDPIFRYDGQEFCPTCQQPDEASASADGDPTGETATDQTDDSTEPAGAPASSSSATTATADDGTASREPSTASERENRLDVPSLSPGEGESATGDAGDLHDARDSLVATLSSFARQAEATDDPRRASDALEAVREAAEALAALERLH